MTYLKINGENFYYMVMNAANKLEKQSDYVNSLNVFPVPDGDTGTNMSMTFKAAVKEIGGFNSIHIGEVSKKLAKGALMGARGNSGVILSQILRGISKALENKEFVTSKEFGEALLEGSKTAYKAVMRPTEGTILTVVRAAGETAVKSVNTDITDLMKEVCDESKKMLDKTPEMLPALKKAKVVDSGGMGLLIILQGMYEALKYDLKSDIENYVSKDVKVSSLNNVSESDIKFGYCTEFIILGNANKANYFKKQIEKLGDSILVVGYEDVIKVHIHTNDPGSVLSKAVVFGELSNIKIDNMREEHREFLLSEEYKGGEEEKTISIEDVSEKKQYGFISVAMGEGIKNIFYDLGIDYVIEGGQTMNPSTQDIIGCIEKLNADHIFILPNNKNIIMAATQAAEISDKDIIVIPTETIPQGITCITMFNPEVGVSENVERLTNAISMVKTGSITYAVRDTEIDGVKIKEGNILGLVEGKIKEVGNEVYGVAEKLLENMVDEDSELISIFYGKDCNEDEVNEFLNKIEDKYENLDVQCYKGEQPLYYFIISVE